MYVVLVKEQLKLSQNLIYLLFYVNIFSYFYLMMGDSEVLIFDSDKI